MSDDDPVLRQVGMGQPVESTPIATDDAAREPRVRVELNDALRTIRAIVRRLDSELPPPATRHTAQKPARPARTPRFLRRFVVSV